MANFFKGVENLLKHPVDEAKWMLDETKGVVKPLLKGDVGDSWDSLKGSFGRHNEMMEDITVPLGGRNKITENPDAAAGAVLGGIFAAPAIGGMFGGAGGSNAALGGSEFATGSFGSSGSGFGGFGTEGAFTNYFKPSSISKPGLSSEGVGWQGGSKLDLGVPDTYEGAKAAGLGEEGFDWSQVARTLQSIKPGEGAPPVRNVGGVGGRFNFDKSLYENPLLTREFNNLYSQPLYNKLT